MRGLIDIAYRGRRAVLGWLRWPTSGTKVMVFDAAGAVLLIRNRYGDSAAFVLPGGGIKRREAPATAAAREVREETGCVIEAMEPIGVYRSAAEGKRDTIHLFRATTRDRPVIDGVEVAEARFAGLDALPPTTSPATRRRIEEVAGTRTVTGVW